MEALPFLFSTLRATVLDATVFAGHLLLYPSGVRQERHPNLPPEAVDDTTRLLPTDGRSHPPVLLLHGFIDNRSVFVLLRRSLLRHGWRHVQALNHSPLTRDIRAAAELLAHQVEEICQRSGHQEVDIVGHSLGGLVGRYYAQRLGSDRVRTLVTLATPHAGTRAAPPLPVHPLLRQMRPDSAVIEELSRPAPGCRTRFISFWSDVDHIMIPRETARLDHPDLLSRSVQVRGIGHLAMPVHSAVISRIRQELANGADPAAQPSVDVA